MASNETKIPFFCQRIPYTGTLIIKEIFLYIWKGGSDARPTGVDFAKVREEVIIILSIPGFRDSLR